MHAKDGVVDIAEASAHLLVVGQRNTGTGLRHKANTFKQVSVRTIWASKCPACGVEATPVDPCTCLRVEHVITTGRMSKIAAGGVVGPFLAAVGAKVQTLLEAGTLDEAGVAAVATLWETAVGYAAGPHAGSGTPAWHSLAMIPTPTGAPVQPMFKRKLRTDRGGKLLARQPWESDLDEEVEAAAARLLKEEASLGEPVLDVAASLAAACGGFMGGFTASTLHSGGGATTQEVLAYVGSGMPSRVHAAARASGFTAVFAPCASFRGQSLLRRTFCNSTKTTLFDQISDYENDPWGRVGVDLRPGAEPELWALGTCRHAGLPSAGVAHGGAFRWSGGRVLTSLMVQAFGYVAGYYSAAIGGRFGPCATRPELLGVGPAAEWAATSSVSTPRAARKKRHHRRKPRPEAGTGAGAGAGAGSDASADTDTEAKRKPGSVSTTREAVERAQEWIGKAAFTGSPEHAMCGVVGPWGVPRRELTMAASPARVALSSPLCCALEGVVFTVVPLEGVDEGLRHLDAGSVPSWAFLTTLVSECVATHACAAKGMSAQLTTHEGRLVVVTAFHESPLDTLDVFLNWWNAAAADGPSVFKDPQNAAAATRLKFDHARDNDAGSESEDGSGPGAGSGSVSSAPVATARQRLMQERARMLGLGAVEEDAANPKTATGWRTWQQFHARSELQVKDLETLGAAVAAHVAESLKRTPGFSLNRELATLAPQRFTWNELQRVMAPDPKAQIVSYRAGVGVYLDPTPGKVFARSYGARWGWRLAEFAAPTVAGPDGDPVGKRPPGTKDMTWDRYEVEVAGALSVRGQALPRTADVERSVKRQEPVIVALKLTPGISAACAAARLEPDEIAMLLQKDPLYGEIPGVVLPFWDEKAYIPACALVVVATDPA